MGEGNAFVPARGTREKKPFSTLHIEVATAETANRVIAEGLVIDYEIKDFERFTKGCTMTQCCNCHKFGHICRLYPNPTTCGHCARAHPSTECNMEITGRYRRCADCSKKGHEAWSTSCEIRKVENTKQRGHAKSGPILPSSRPRTGPVQVLERKHQPGPWQHKQQKGENRTPLR